VTTLVDSTVNDTGEELRELVRRAFDAGAQFGEQISKLEAARATPAGNGHATRVPRRAPATNGAPAPAATKTATRKRAARSHSRRSTRATQALELVADHPGITIADLAGKMGIEPPYLYRVMPKLASEGRVKRDGDGWHPVS
jgi:predicted Rossmann fold nucleotide-binding protein DprA/Smf involved in DNA uptake